MSLFVYPSSVRAVTGDFAEHIGRNSVNPGVDYGLPYGTPVVALATGTIVDVDNDNGGSGGRMIGIDFDNGWGADYLHLSTIIVSEGQRVTQGQVIGYSGGSANGSNWGVGNHLHLSLRQVKGRHYTNYTNVDAELHLDGRSPNDTPAQPGEKYPVNRGKANPQLVVDGDWGRATTIALQARLGVKQDGIFGPASIKALQPYLGQPADGIFGTQTKKALQMHLGVTVDGAIGPKTVTALQQRLNAGTF